MQSCIESHSSRISALEERNRELSETVVSIQNQIDRDQLQRRRASVRQGVTELRMSRSRARKPDSPLPILVKLRTRDLVLKFLSARRAKGRLVVSELLSLTAATASDLSRHVYINEALPYDLHHLLLAAKTTARALSYKYVWHSDGLSLLRRSDGAKVERIHSLSQLRDLEATHSSSATTIERSDLSAFNSMHSQAAAPIHLQPIPASGSS